MQLDQVTKGPLLVRRMATFGTRRILTAEVAMRLAQFISKNSDRIASEWARFAGTRLPAASTMTYQQRRDHIDAMLRRISRDLETPQTKHEQVEKAKGHADAAASATDSAATSHGSDRAASGFTPEQMISEFRALRACVLRLWSEDTEPFGRSSVEDIMRFNEAVDQVLAESIVSYTNNVDSTKDLFLGVLGHDLRAPLGAIMMGATVLITDEGPDWSHAKTASRMLNSGTRMNEIIRDLLDFTRGRLSGGIPVVRAEMDLEELVQQIIEEMSAYYPQCSIKLESRGPVRGDWDRGRLGQMLSNLIGNACEHGSKGAPVEVTLQSDSDAGVVAVRNRGPVIEPQHLREIFDPFRQLERERAKTRAPKGLGLGLYIAKAIVTAHEGTIDVASTSDGTTFTVSLPRVRRGN